MRSSIQLMAKRSAAKYKNNSHYEDIVSEGVLAAYEEIEGNPEATIARIYQVISTAQWKFLNVDCLSVTVPFQLVRVAKGLGSPEDKQGFSDDTIKWAKLICDAPQFDSKFHDMDGESDQAEEYEEQALVQAVWEAAAECLTKEEYGLFHAHFELSLDGKSLGDMTGVSKQAISKKFKAINRKVQKHVLNKKWDL